MHEDLVPDINQSLEISLPASISPEELKDQLSAYINHLINTDFEKLVYYLYRIDVDETRMRNLLDKSAGENAAALIAELIIERQQQKIESRNTFDTNDNIPDEEKW
ncbi:MAG: hypothetical protein ABL876_02005 [Chitinophagaceae bacterium]